MSHFTFILKNEKTASYKKSILAIIGLAFIFFIYLAITTDDYKTRNTALFTIGFILISYLTKHFFAKRNKEFSAAFSSIGFIIFIFLKLQLWWQAAAIACVLFFFFYSIRILKVVISSEGIVYPSFPVKKIEWERLNNLLLKDNLLTIDFKNNKLIQSEIFTDQKEVVVDEIEFNDFCRQQINVN